MTASLVDHIALHVVAVISRGEFEDELVGDKVITPSFP